MPYEHDEYITYYTVKDSKGEDLFSRHPENGLSDVCFADYVDDEIEFGSNTISVFILKNYDKKFKSVENVLTSLERAKEHVFRLSESCFPIHDFKNEKDWYEIVIKEEDYLCKGHVRLFLDFVRCGWEKSMTNLLTEYFKINVNIRRAFDYVTLLQILSIKHYDADGRGHGLPSCSYMPTKYHVVTPEEYIAAYNDKKFMKTYHGSTIELWTKISDDKFDLYKKNHNKKLNTEVTDDELEELAKIKFKDVASIKKALKIINPK